VEEGRAAYAPALLLKVGLYAYAMKITSTRRLEQRIREERPLRYLAGGAAPDHWTLNHFRRRHRRAINDLFTQVVELARQRGLGRLGHVAVDSTRLPANASRDRIETLPALRAQRAQDRRAIRRWQQACDAEDPNESPGMRIDRQVMEVLQPGLAETERRLQKLEKAGVKKLSRTDPASRFLRERGRFVLGYNVARAASEDHLIVEPRVGQEAADNDRLLPRVEGVEKRCGERPCQVSADSGFFSLDNLKGLEKRRIDGYVPDSNLARGLNRGGRGRTRAVRAAHRRMRRKLRTARGRATDTRRKTLIEPVIGALKEQRGLRRFRLRGLAKVGIELALATTAYNLTRRWAHQRVGV
jgi:hypothetical protein